METNSQLHHDLILPSDEGVEESLVDMEGLLSSRHKQLLLKVIFLTDILTLHNSTNLSSRSVSLKRRAPSSLLTPDTPRRSLCSKLVLLLLEEVEVEVED